MIKLKQLLTESLSAHDLGKILVHAYVTVFDVDEVSMIKAIYIPAPAFSHTWASIHVRIVYKGNDYLISNLIVHYKIPHSELEKLTSTGWDAMLVQTDKIPTMRFTKNDILHSNPLVRYNSAVYKNELHKDKLDPLNMDLIGEVHLEHTLGDLVSKTKDLIDKSGNDNGGDRDNIDSPVSPEADLVPTH